MKTIKNIINKIQDLEAEFDIFNSRILEFANSTNLWDIDQKLLDKYISSINNYLSLIQTYETEVLSIKSDNDDYKAEKDLVIFRLEKLWKIFNNTLNKLNIINNTFIKSSPKNEPSIDIDFGSRDEMLEINKNLYEFYNNYNKNLEFQKKYNISIFLNNTFESKKEKELSSLELTSAENTYFIELNDIFEDLEKLELDFSILFEKANEINKIFFSNFKKYYYPKNKKSFISNNFDLILSDKYVNEDFIIKKSSIYKDFSKLKKIISDEYSNLEILYSVFVIQSKYESFSQLNKKYNFFLDTKIYDENYNFYSKICKINFNNTTEAVEKILTDNRLNSITKIKLNNEIFEVSSIFLESYDNLYRDYSDKLNFWFMWSMYSLFDKPWISEKYIKTGLLKLKEDFNNEYKNLNLDFNKTVDLKYLLKLLKKYNSNLIEIKKTIIDIDSYISKEIIYNNNVLSKYKTNTRSKLNTLKLLLYWENNYQISSDFERYIIGIMNTKYNTSKNNYYSAQRSYSSSSGSSWSSWSSSSFSSSYSSSGSSSW